MDLVVRNGADMRSRENIAAHGRNLRLVGRPLAYEEVTRIGTMGIRYTEFAIALCNRSGSWCPWYQSTKVTVRGGYKEIPCEFP